TIWLLGSAALTTSKSFLWHGGLSLSGIWAWLTMCLRIFCDPLEGFWASVAAGLLAFAALGLAGLGARDLRPKARACLLWLAGYALLYVLWEPYTIVYRITDLLPLWFLAAEALKGRGRVAALASWAVLAGALNAATAVGPRADIARNEAYQDAIAIAKLAPENAWVAVSSAGQVYVPYFAHLRPLNLRYFPDAEALKARVDALRAAGDPVIVAPEVLADSSAGVLLSGLEFREIGRRGGSAIYEIR
ncbi:MAG TPA: hypothetical protein VNI01_12955, partial [Elusimicrobiota bacterium]|nr:hypothetical protein [Elusimicrobiota bacterium]